MPYTPCCCGDPCCGRFPGNTLLLTVITWANGGFFPDCLLPDEYELEWDDDREYEGVTGVWAVTIPSTGEPDCFEIEIILYCSGTDPDGYTLDMIMDGNLIYQDNPQPDRECNPFFMPFRESDIAIDVTEMP